MSLSRLHPLVGALLLPLAACSSPAPDRQPDGRVELERATGLVRARIFEATPTMNPAMQAPLVELTWDELWRRLGVQLFQVTEGVRACETYLVFGGRAHHLCGGFGGHGIQSACVTDLDDDGAPELTYTYSWGSGIHRSLVGVARVAEGRLESEDATLAYVGDLFVRRESDAHVVVEIGRYEWAFGAWKPEARLGTVALERDGDRWGPRVELAPLSEEHARALRTP